MSFNQPLRVALLIAMAWPISAHAQEAPPPTQTTAPPTFVQPDVSDPMLAPPEAGGTIVKSWDDAVLLMQKSPDFLTGVDAVERTLAEHRIALAGVLPTLYGQGQYAHNFNVLDITLAGVTIVSPPPTIWSIGATLSWNIINPRAIYALGTSDLQTDVAKLSLDDRRRVLAASVVSAMLATLAANRVAELDRVGLRAALERLTLTQTRLKFARGTELDIDRAQQDVAAARATLINGDEQLRQSRENLGHAVGSPTPLAAAPELDLDGFEASVAKTCHIAKDIEQRADVAAARQRVAVADRAITDAKLMFAPYLNVGSQASWASASTLGPLESWSVAATITLPLYDGGVRYGQLRDAKAATDQAMQALQAARVEALIEAARASRAIAVDTAARDVAKQQRDLAQRIDERTRQGYASGIGTSLDLVTSAQALRDAEINLVLLDFQLAQARAGAVLVNAECVY
jgi:outer membrane protein, multidrug efflux system